jgi:Cu+-exporting ATPase
MFSEQGMALLCFHFGSTESFICSKNMEQALCYHCGDNCRKEIIHFDGKDFCCAGCKTVYDILKDNQLCTYYDFQSRPGLSPDPSIYPGKYDYLDNEAIGKQLTRFADETHKHVVFFVPKIHCSSCIWLLENLHKLNPAILHSSVNFVRKEVTIIFDATSMQLSEVATLLAHVGYEPLITLENLDQKARPVFNQEVLKIGIAGFCFGNIMMLSFPDYFSLGGFLGPENLGSFFAYLSLLLALPVLCYAATGFFRSAWKSMRHGYLNIDAPIALAILVTFLRSVYEIVGGTGTGYLDSMTGIVFFMLIGRYFQNKTYDTLSFDRDYKSYFPVGVTVKAADGSISGQPVSGLKKGDIIVVRSQELIPVDAILMTGQTHIDYSFITGESAPVTKSAGDHIYAGGRQLEGAIVLQVNQPVSQSYLTQLWNTDTLSREKTSSKLVESINSWFTFIVLAIAFGSALFWFFADSGKALNAFTAVLIVACPCGLLLTTTFANGTILRIFGRRKFYLKNAAVIDKLARADTIIFDKTGTISHGSDVRFEGPALSKEHYQIAASLAAQSSHPLSMGIHQKFSGRNDLPVTGFLETPGLGIQGLVNGQYVMLGSGRFIVGYHPDSFPLSTRVFLSIDGKLMGYFLYSTAYRSGLSALVQKLAGGHVLQLLSGDNDSDRLKLQHIFGAQTTLLFNQRPEMKMGHVRALREKGRQVMMIGDGLNDAGALRESDIGISVSDDTNTFSPACDAILAGEALALLPSFIRMAKMVKKIIVITFTLSLAYNITGLYFAIQGTLSPVIAAILMPASSISIILLTTVSTSVIAGNIRSGN